MPDRSSHQGPPEEWNHGSHAARGHGERPAESEGYSNGTAGSHRVRDSNGHGTGPTDAYGTTAADPLGTGADSFGVSQADPFGARVDAYRASQTDAFAVRPAGTFGTGAADPFGDADPFGTPKADPFGAPKADPFGPATTAAFAAAAADAGTARPDAERPAIAVADLWRDRTQNRPRLALAAVVLLAAVNASGMYLACFRYGAHDIAREPNHAEMLAYVQTSRDLIRALGSVEKAKARVPPHIRPVGLASSSSSEPTRVARPAPDDPRTAPADRPITRCWYVALQEPRPRCPATSPQRVEPGAGASCC